MCYSQNFNMQAADPNLPPDNNAIHDLIFEVDEFVHAHHHILAEVDEEAHATYDHATADATRAAIAQASGHDIVFIPFQNWVRWAFAKTVFCRKWQVDSGANGLPAPLKRFPLLECKLCMVSNGTTTEAQNNPWGSQEPEWDRFSHLFMLKILIPCYTAFMYLTCSYWA